MKQGLKRPFLKVYGENAIGHENSLRPLILSHISALSLTMIHLYIFTVLHNIYFGILIYCIVSLKVRLREQLSPPRIQEVRRSALEAVLRLEWSVPAIDEHLLTMALLEGQPQPHFEFSLHVRCNRTLFPVLHSCSSHFVEVRASAIADVSSYSGGTRF